MQRVLKCIGIDFSAVNTQMNASLAVGLTDRTLFGATVKVGWITLHNYSLMKRSIQEYIYLREAYRLSYFQYRANSGSNCALINKR
jgi:hypothetical protein